MDAPATGNPPDAALGGALILILGAGAWTYGLAPQDRQDFWITQHLGRFTGIAWPGGHVRPFYYYGYAWLYSFAPWSLLLPAVLPWACAGPESQRVPTRFLLAGLGAGFLLLSVATTKRETYLLPLSPGIAILTAAWLEEQTDPTPWSRALVLALAGLLAIGHCMVWGLAFYYRSFAGLALAVAASGGIAFLNTDRSRPALLPAAAVSLAAGAMLVLIPPLDRAKSLEPFCLRLPAVDPVAAYRPDEMTLSMIPFYSGHHVRPIDTLQEAEAAAGSTPAFIVVVPKRHSPRADEELVALYPYVWLDQTLPGDRRLMLRSNRPK